MTKLYEDELIIMELAEQPVAVGHLLVKPKQETSDLQSASDELVLRLFTGANNAATALFELANAQGTNIILEEHPLRLNVVARAQSDGLDFLWEPKQANPQELQAVAKSIKDKLDIEQWKRDNPSQSSSERKEEIIEQKDDKPNMLFRSIQRVP